jgi:FMN-binding protein
VRRIVIALTGTVSGLIMLFSYHTSLSGAGALTGPASTGVSTTTAQGGGSSSGTGGSSSGSSVPSTAPSSAPSSGSGSGPGSGSSKVTGDTAQTQWGPVQVRITVSGGKITHVTAVNYPNGNGRDQQINSYALPVLAQEALAAQSARIDHVSGATVTSDGYVQSLQSAIDKANL